MTDGHHPKFAKLIDFLVRIPAIEINDTSTRGIGSGESDAGWWVKFQIDIDHDLAWHTVQEMGHVLNYLALNERLPTVFKPVSPPPYMNGGPEEYLSWVIEGADMPPGTVATWLEERLPKPVEEEAAWLGEADDEEGGEDEDENEDGPTGWLEDEDDED
jgi:hypothetical protein